MKNKYFVILMALLVVVGIHGIAQCAVVTNTFLGIIADGPRTGDNGIGSFTYDPALVITGNETIVPKDGLQVSFAFDGQSFGETNDIDFIIDFPALMFSNFLPISLDFLLVDGMNGVEFNDPDILALSMFDLFPSSGADDFLSILSIETVPITGTFWLLGSGLIGIVGFRRNLKNV